MDKELAARLAKALAVTCVRNTSLEDLHAGISPSSRAGDHSDVTVVTPYGEIPWNKVSRIAKLAPPAAVPGGSLVSHQKSPGLERLADAPCPRGEALFVRTCFGSFVQIPPSSRIRTRTPSRRVSRPSPLATSSATRSRGTQAATSDGNGNSGWPSRNSIAARRWRGA